MVRIAPPPLIGRPGQWMLLRNASAADPVPAASSIRERRGAAAGRDGLPGEDSDGESRYLALLLGGRAGEEEPEGEIFDRQNGTSTSIVE